MEDYLRDSPFDDSAENTRSLNALSAQLGNFDFDAAPNVFPSGQFQDPGYTQSQLGHDSIQASQFAPTANQDAQFGQDAQSGQFGTQGDTQFDTQFGAQFDTQFDTQFESQFPAAQAPDPYTQTFDFLGSPQTDAAHDLRGPSDPAGDYGLSSSFHDPKYGDVTSLDQLVSPDVHGNLDMFASPTYFLPGLRNYNLLNAITENSPGTLNDAFSPRRSPAALRHGSISVADGYLSLRAFRSPVMAAHDPDALSPYGSYLNSPPPIHVIPSTSIPAVPFKKLVGATLSPPAPGLGVSAPTVRQADPSSGLTQEEKAKRRREFHNAVERRRRDLIKEKIKELGVLVPPLLLTPEVCAVQALQKQASASQDTQELLAAVKAKDAKPNKAVILHTSVDYIRHLTYVLEQQKTRREELEDAISRVESRVGAKSFDLSSASASASAVGSALALSDFNPDEFFSDVLGENLQY